MKTIQLKMTLFGIITTCTLVETMHAQQGTTTLRQDPQFEMMLNEKRKINTSITVNDKYKIQVFNGDSETSKRTLSDFKKDFKECDGTIVFNTPAYKVWVGDYRTRIEAERNLADIKKKYPNAFLVKPNK